MLVLRLMRHPVLTVFWAPCVAWGNFGAIKYGLGQSHGRKVFCSKVDCSVTEHIAHFVCCTFNYVHPIRRVCIPQYLDRSLKPSR